MSTLAQFIDWHSSKGVVNHHYSQSTDWTREITEGDTTEYFWANHVNELHTYEDAFIWDGTEFVYHHGYVN